MLYYSIVDDIRFIEESLNLGDGELANQLGVDRGTLIRWKNGSSKITDNLLNSLYSLAYNNGLRINKAKNDIFCDKYNGANTKVLFHGAKQPMIGDAAHIIHADKRNDFGDAFYCGESFEQSATFVCSYPESSVYTFVLYDKDLNYITLDVSNDWMLAVSYYRGYLEKYMDSEAIRNLIGKIEQADCIIAPIADNRMFQIIQEFARGNITDVQCSYCLSATNLGLQYVFRTERAVEQLECITNNFITNEERNIYTGAVQENHKISDSKLKYAQREFRGQGKYIDELL